MTQVPVWATEAGAAPVTGPLPGSLRVDVAVIGAGYLGVTAALALAAGGARVAVLERGNLTDGASALNGGQVIPGLKRGPSGLNAQLGRERGEAVTRFVMRSAGRVFDLIREHRIDCGAVRSGWIQAAASAAAWAEQRARVAELSERGGDAVLLDARAVRDLLGSRPGAYCGGWLNRDAGTLHPLNYLYGLVRAAIAAGAQIHTLSRAVRIDRQAPAWRVRLAHGPLVSAEQVLVCTNAYSDELWPGLRQSILPATSLQIATAPLPPELRAQILPQGQAVSDSRRVMNYFRIGPQGRFMIGGRGPFRAARRADYDGLSGAMRRLYPQLRGIGVEYRWAGRVALTRDFLPHVHQPRPGLWCVLGCNGRGIALASSLGSAIGGQLLGRSEGHPFAPTPLRSLPLHRLHRFYAGALIQYFRLLDRLE
ncbi:MAG: FAD-binding oxidoreductase [Gammaproteobacteria bacterium]|nr:FAD-binding oxidoreductase [Gammaproteobacteria bacterium]